MSGYGQLFMYWLAAIFFMGISSQPADAASARSLAVAFVSHCILNAGRIDKIEAAARIFEYKELDKDQSLMMAPQDPNAYFKGWFVSEGEGAPYGLGVSEGSLDDRQLAICTIVSTSFDSDRLISMLQSLIKFGPQLSDDVSAGQRIRFWDLSSVTPGAFLSVTDAKSLGIDGGNISFITPKSR